MAKVRDRTGEKNVSNEGYSLEIVACRTAHDIDVLVAGKHIVKGRRYDHFKNGAIHNPDSHYAKFSCKKGETALSNQGYSLEIIEYRSSKDMDVLVAGKHIATGVSYNNFKSGSVMNPDYYGDIYVGKTGVSNEGYAMTIVAHRDYMDIDVIIAENVLVEHTSVMSFNRGAIGNPNHYRDKYMGVKSISNEGYDIEVVGYRTIDDIDVLVDNKHIVKNARYGNFIRGKVVNPYHRSVMGVGFMGVGQYDALHETNLTGTACYRMWAGMLKRCYDPKVHKKHPTYLGCVVVEDWHNFQTFADWYYKNKYTIVGETMSLDKDIVVKGNKVYSPETCVIVPHTINAMFTATTARKKSGYPMGVSKVGNRYAARAERKLIKTDRLSKHIGMFDTPALAFEAYKQVREAYIKQVADEYKDKIPQKLYDALYAYTIDTND